MSIYPTLRYQDAHAAIDFLERAFGFERKALYDDGGVVQHAELRFGDGMVMLGSVKEGDFDRIAPPPGCATARDPEGNLWSFGTYDPRAT